MAESKEELLKKAFTNSKNSLSAWTNLININSLVWSKEDENKIAQWMIEDIKRMQWIASKQREEKIKIDAQSNKTSMTDKKFVSAKTPSATFKNTDLTDLKK